MIPPSSDAVEVRLGTARVLRLQVLDGVLVMASGHLEDRTYAQSFVGGATVMIPLRVLDEVRVALAQIARSG